MNLLWFIILVSLGIVFITWVLDYAPEVIRGLLETRRARKDRKAWEASTALEEAKRWKEFLGTPVDKTMAIRIVIPPVAKTSHRKTRAC